MLISNAKRWITGLGIGACVLLCSLALLAGPGLGFGAAVSVFLRPESVCLVIAAAALMFLAMHNGHRRRMPAGDSVCGKPCGGRPSSCGGADGAPVDDACLLPLDELPGRFQRF